MRSIINRVYVHGDPMFGQKRGIGLNSRDSDDHRFVHLGLQGHRAGLAGDRRLRKGQGTYRIENNYLEAAGENVLIGGSDPTIPNLVSTT